MIWRKTAMMLVIFVAVLPFLAIPDWLGRTLAVIAAGSIFVIIYNSSPQEQRSDSGSSSSDSDTPEDKKQSTPDKNDRPPVDIESAESDRYIAMDAWEEKRNRYKK